MRFGGGELVLIAGPCVIEGEEFTLRHARRVAEIAARHGAPVVFKCSFDKANRTSGKSFRGPGLREGLRVLARVKAETGLSVLTDVHSEDQCAPAAEVVDVLQIPAFLCRQTDLLLAAGRTGRPVNVKKGQFLAPEDMKNAVEKLREVGCAQVLLTERGSSFGYQGNATGGDRTQALPLARAAAAVGIDALFCEVHEDPDRALSDGPNSLTFAMWDALVGDVLKIRRALSAAHQP